VLNKHSPSFKDCLAELRKSWRRFLPLGLPPCHRDDVTSVEFEAGTRVAKTLLNNITILLLYYYNNNRNLVLTFLPVDTSTSGWWVNIIFANDIDLACK
jgi:hypothetical protein